MQNVEYSFVTDSDSKLAFESKVKSFGVNHTTRKDLVSFYTNFSDKAYFDTGLLPVDGTGMLSIRKAGNHTQIGYQYKPGMYFINWGAYERDPNAASIYVAQPYRIVIADIYNNNLLGARTFYTPIPVQHPQTPLYHVNLPNINCQGYRGNGVGWICLYHTEDISKYPFNEKIAKILERCSGVEAYNDANMSETDGPRFYHKHNKPRHVWDPTSWEKYSEQNGVEWTLDPDLWIPVLVQDLDHQEKHYPDGVPLTYADAILGNYQAYYSDPIKPKPVNKLTREELELDNDDIFNMFKTAYNSSTEFGNKVVKLNPMTSSLKVREELSQVFVAPPQHAEEEDEEDGNYTSCCSCGCTINLNVSDVNIDMNGSEWCSDCSDNYLVWVDHLSTFVRESDDDLKFSTIIESYYYLPKWHEKVVCAGCGEDHPFDTSNYMTSSMMPIWEDSNNPQTTVCSSCLPSSSTGCTVCGESLPDHNVYRVQSISSIKKNFEIQHVCNACYQMNTTPLERSCDLNEDTTVTCLCGELHSAGSFQKLSDSGKIPYPLHHTFMMNSKVGEFIKKNLTLAHNHERYAPIFDSVEKDVTFNTHIWTDRLCPSCYMDVITMDSNSFIQSYSETVESKLAEILFVQDSWNNLYGTNINISPNF